MSYILDALKRADAERERGQVPGLHSQTAHAPAQRADSAADHLYRTAHRRTWWASGALALAVAVAGGLWLFRGTPTPPASERPLAAPVLPPMVDPGRTTPPPVPSQPAPARPSEPALPILAPQPAPPPAPTPPAPVTAEPQKAEAKVDPKAENKVLPFASLSPEQRARLPQLNISGASYSENPAHRLLIVNGQVLQEGQEVVPGLVLERIGPHEAVLNQRGLRLSIGY